MKKHRFNRHGCNLFYRRWSGGESGQVLVMFHGLASNSTRWTEFAESMTEESSGPDDNWQIICPDLRGHGHSRFRGRLRAEDWMADLASLLDQVGCQRAVVGGHCLGANLALRFGLEYPDRVRGVVMVEPMLPQALGGTLAKLRPVGWLLPLLALPVRAINSLGIYRRNLPELDLAELDRKTRASMARHGSHKAMLKRYASPRKELAHMAVAPYLQSLHQVLRRIDGIENLGCPSLALLSEGGLLADPERSRELLQAIPEIRIRQIAALHWIPTEEPEAMTREIRDFLDDLSAVC